MEKMKKPNLETANTQEIQNYIDYCSECVDKANSRLAEYIKNDEKQKVIKTIGEAYQKTMSKYVKDIVVDICYIKSILKKTGCLTDQSYNEYIKEFEEINPDYFDNKEK